MIGKYQIVHRVENNVVSLYYMTAHGEQLIGKILCPSDGAVEENFEMGKSIANCIKKRMNCKYRR